MNALTAPEFLDPETARKHLEALRWPHGPICPHCGSEGKAWTLKKRKEGAKTREGLYRCASYQCRKQFTVTVGTLFEGSKVPLNKWLMAVYLMCASKKGMSAHQLHRMLGVTYKTAWFMGHRIREAMADPVFATKLGNGGKPVEVDETFWGNNKKIKGTKGRGYAHKEKIFSLVEREGKVRSFHVPRVNSRTLLPIMKEHIAKDARIMTDDAGQYFHLCKHFDHHEFVRHSAHEYVRGQIHTNTIEGYFSILKRGLVGTFHHVGPQHLRRYVGEFDFRYNNRQATDKERTQVALKGIAGKRLLYRDSSVRDA